MFEIENKFYKEHIKEFREKYLGKHIVIKGEELKGIYNIVMKKLLKNH